MKIINPQEHKDSSASSDSWEEEIKSSKDLAEIVQEDNNSLISAQLLHKPKTEIKLDDKHSLIGLVSLDNDLQIKVFTFEEEFYSCNFTISFSNISLKLFQLEKLECFMKFRVFIEYFNFSIFKIEPVLEHTQFLIEVMQEQKGNLKKLSVRMSNE